MNNNVKDWSEWTQQMKQKKYKKHTLYYNDFVGGSGVVFNKKTLLPFNTDKGRLHGWTEMQSMHKEWTKSFYDGVFINLLDMIDDNIPNYDLYPKYYAFTQRKI